MHTIYDNNSHLLVTFDDEFDRRDLSKLMHHEAFFDEEPVKNTIWLIGKHPARLSMGELPSLVDDAAALPLERVNGKKTAIVADHRSTRVTMQILADGLQHRLPLRCRTFKSIEEAYRWLSYIDVCS